MVLLRLARAARLLGSAGGPRLSRALAASAGTAVIAHTSLASWCEAAASAPAAAAAAGQASEYEPPPAKLDDPEENAKILARWRSRIQEAREAFRKHDVDGAERMLLLALEEAAHFGQSSGPVATSLLNLAQLYKRTGRLAESEPLLVRAADVLDQTAGPNNKVTLLALLDLASTQLGREHALAAAETYEDVLGRLDVAELNQPHGRDALRDVRAGCLLSSAKCQVALEQLGVAEAQLREALAIVEGKHGAASTKVLAPCVELARVLARRGDADAATALLARSRALQGLKPAQVAQLGELGAELSALLRAAEEARQ